MGILNLVIFVPGNARKHYSSPLCKAFRYYRPSNRYLSSLNLRRHERSAPTLVQNGIEFNVDNVLPGKSLKDRSRSKSHYKRVWKKLGKFEQSSPLPNDTVLFDFVNRNMFIESAFQAYRNHFPLKITPDIIWITIMQGFARHVNKTPEKFRS